MPVPANIERIHLIQAIEKIDREGVPPYRNYKTTACQYNGQLNPCKLIVSWANLIVNGEEIDNDPANFQTDFAVEYLIDKGFTIIRVK